MESGSGLPQSRLGEAIYKKSPVSVFTGPFGSNDKFAANYLSKKSK